MSISDQIRQALITKIQQLIAALQAQQNRTPAPTFSSSMNIYRAASSCLHTHITLDPSVPPEVGCAEAVSYVLQKAGIKEVPAAGVAGTANLYSFLSTNKQFVPTTTPVPGDVVISPSGQSTKGSPHGHTGIVANYGILSNDSDTGLFMEKYTLASWQNFFGGVEGFPVYYFHAV